MNSPFSISRRRVFAGGMGLLAACGISPRSAFSQELPPCQDTIEIGNWRLRGSLWVDEASIRLNAKAIRSSLRFYNQTSPVVTSADSFAATTLVSYDPGSDKLSIDWPDDSFQSMLDLDLVVHDEDNDVWYRKFRNQGLPLDAITAQLFVDERLHSGIQTRFLNEFQVNANTLMSARVLRIDLADDRGLITGRPGMILASLSADLTGLTELFAQRDKLEANIRSAEATGRCERVDCFITTACTRAVGLPDNCWELRTLRRFRDQVLEQVPGGAAKVARYYEVAPRLVEKVSSHPKGRAILLKVYALYILPSAVAARLGFNKTAFRIYERAALTLREHVAGAPGSPSSRQPN
jgi:hypothetical protein